MARAGVAHASACSDSIKGLAQSIPNPGCWRRLAAEPALRRAVPLLIIVFLVTVGVGAVIQGYERHRDAIALGLEDLESVADLIVDRIDAALERGATTVSGKLSSLMPARAAAHERTILLIGPGGTITASEPALSAGMLKDFSQTLLDGQLQATVRAPRGGAEVISTDGTPLLVTVRKLQSSAERLVVIEPRAAALTAWHADTMLTVTLLATTGGVLLILGFAFHWQSLRAQEADVIHEAVRSRIDTALDRGRCGLWDWDLANGVIYWSYSMFDILGLPARDEPLNLGEVSALIHPEDINLHELATQFANDRSGCIDRAFRMRRASGDWLWMQARWELVRQVGEPRAHLIGIVIDVTEHTHLAGQSAASDMRLRDAVLSVANMSHELRTPLNAIIGFSEIMESGLFGPLGVDKYVEYCRDIRESGSHLLDVISDILDLSRTEASHARLDIQDLAVPVQRAAINAEQGHKISMSCSPHGA